MDFSGWTNEDPRIILATGLGFVVAILVYRWNRNIHKKLERIKAECIENGTVIRAKCIKTFRTHEDDGDSRQHGIYEYELKGKTRKYRYSSTRGVQYGQINLYYGKGVRKPFSDDDIPARFAPSVAILAGIVTVLLTLHFTGYITIPFLKV